MIKPPIARLGGKSRSRQLIIQMLPEHICYNEVFFGAGWVFFGKEPSKIEVINDIDGELINLFRSIKYHNEEIQRLLNYEISSRDQFDYYKNIPINALTELQRAVRFMYLISQSFASKGHNYGYGTTKRPAPQIFDTAILKTVKERLRGTYIENKSFEEVIHRYDRSHTIHFCDPPYYQTAGYDVKFGEKEHLLLLDTLKNIKGKFLLTINDHPRTREWYHEFNIISHDVHYSASRETHGRKANKELIIRNY